MPGHMLSYQCSGCGMNGEVSPGVKLEPDGAYVIAFDPEKNNLTTLRLKDAQKKGLQIFENPYIAGNNWRRWTRECDEQGRDAGERSPERCPRCGDTLTFSIMGHWD